MLRIALAATDVLVTKAGYAYRLVSGCVALFLESEGGALRISGSWGCLYWHDAAMQGPATIQAVEDADVECHPIADVLQTPATFCSLMAEGYERYLLLRLNLFGYEAHVQQVLSHYQNQYLLMFDDIARDLQQRGLQTLPQTIACQQELQADQEAVAALVGKNCNAGKITLYNQEPRAAAGLYLVTEGPFSVQLGHHEVLNFQSDQLVYLPAHVFALPGYKTQHGEHLLRVGNDREALLELMTRCPKVSVRFLKLYGLLAASLLMQCLISCRTGRELRAYLSGGEGTLHSYFLNISRHAASESVLASYEKQAAALGESCRVAQEQLCAEEARLFQT